MSGVTTFFSSRSRHGHGGLIMVTVTVVTGRDRYRESRSFFRVCRDSGSSFVNYVFCWRRSDIPNLLFKATRIYCGEKKKTKIFNIKWQNLSHHFSIRDCPWPTSSHGHGHGLLKKNWPRSRAVIVTTVSHGGHAGPYSRLTRILICVLELNVDCRYHRCSKET